MLYRELGVILFCFSLPDIHGVRMDIWYSIKGAGLESLAQDVRYPDKPDSSKTIENMASPLNMGDHYGLRLRAYFVVCCFNVFRALTI